MCSCVGAAAKVTNAERAWKAKAAITSLPYPILSTITPPMMIPKQKPVKPAPLMSPNSWPVKPNSAPQFARIPPRMPKPMPAARMAIKPAHNKRPELGAIPSCLIFIIDAVNCLVDWVWWRLILDSECKRRQLHDLAALQRRLMRAQSNTGPVRGLLGVGEWVAIFSQRAQKLVREVRMRTAMPGALREAQVGFLA